MDIHTYSYTIHNYTYAHAYTYIGIFSHHMYFHTHTYMYTHLHMLSVCETIVKVRVIILAMLSMLGTYHKQNDDVKTNNRASSVNPTWTPYALYLLLYGQFVQIVRGPNNIDISGYAYTQK